jgi:hypothetical protein
LGHHDFFWCSGSSFRWGCASRMVFAGIGLAEEESMASNR